MKIRPSGWRPAARGGRNNQRRKKTMAKADTAEAPMDDVLYVPGNHPQEGK